MALTRYSIDAPCSGLGIIRRHPEGKWQKKEELIFESQKIQKRIIENLSKYLKNGGVLVYSTCSTEKRRTEDVVEDFLNNHPEFKVDDIKQYFSKQAGMLVDEKRFLHTSPINYRMDEVFCGKVEKTIMKMILARKYKCTGCKTCEKAYSSAIRLKKTPLSASRGKDKTRMWRCRKQIYGFVQIRCRHCEDAACIKACIAGALYHKDAEGYTIHDQKNASGAGCVS